MPSTRDPGLTRDQRARAQALDATRSFIVEAPAGSGKTELLLQRFLALLARVERPEAIVAMTFTRKAAGEIRDRIVRALRDARDPPPAEAHRALTWRLAREALHRDAALGWNLAAQPARLQVHTIDALCMALARQAPLAVKLGSMPRMIEQARAPYLEAARAALEEAPSGDSAWRRLLAYLDNDAERLVDLVAGLLAKREQWLRHLVVKDAAALRAALEHALAAEIDAALRALAALLPRASERTLADMIRYAAANLARDSGTHPLAACAGGEGLAPARIEGLSRWQAIADWLLKKDGELRERVDRRDGFPPKGAPKGQGGLERDARKKTMEALLADLSAVSGFASALQVVRRLPPPRYEEAAWNFIAALLEVLPRVAARLELVFAGAGAIDFNEATLIALRALQGDDGPSELLLALDVRLEHLLVDEFQDTSLAQCELIERLTAEWVQGDGRTLFIVGDPMQSIYRFRDADLSLFLEAQRRQRIGAVALEPLTLTQNFRSQRSLVEWVNRVFPRVLGAAAAAPGAAVCFKPAIAAREAERGPGVTLDVLPTPDLEAAAVVAHVRSALETDAQTIAILVRKRADLAQLLPALREAGIAYAAVDLDRYSQRQALLDLVSLAHALVQPADRAAWLATLRAPWCGLTLPDLFALTAACGDSPLSAAVARPDDLGAQLSRDGQLRLARLAAAVAPALRERGRVPLATMVRGVWLALGGPACVKEAIDLDAAQHVFALLAEHAAGSDVADWPAFAAAIEELYAKQETDAATRVRIMTLHRAKGLEFDVVILPALAAAQGGRDPELLSWRERRPAGLLLAPTSPTAVERNAADPVYAYLRMLDQMEDAAELARLLYVGCTRAKRRLHLTASLGIERAPESAPRWRSPQRGSSLAALWPVLEREAAEPRDEQRHLPERSAPGSVPLRRLPLEWRLPEAPVMPRAPVIEAQRAAEPIEFDWAREAARRIGTLAHRLLQQIAVDGVERWTAERVEAQRAVIARELIALGFTSSEADGALGDVLASIRLTLDDPRGRWLFDAAHTDARSEFALTEWRDGAFVHHVLDRSFVDAEGTRWIVDFKLSRHEGAGRETFLDNERERYRAQLEAYAKVMRKLEARRIRLGLYFPLLGGWREWPAPG